ncbi:hypothetical protein ABT369_21250 [Dactylosporangium sp. NPDC000244]|uniref:hypothetical protein n=1 Tax=Dactylosporangium sp. NPDC000244 TaxID=3154365 RepID=UPI0033255C7A
MSAEAGPYLESRRLDDLARMITELASEVWILRDRSIVLEELLVRGGVLTAEQIDELVPGGAVRERIAAERAAFVRRVFGAILDEDTRTAAAMQSP